jgi:hypothetical protein
MKLYRAEAATYLAATDAGAVRNVSQKSQRHNRIEEFAYEFPPSFDFRNHALT